MRNSLTCSISTCWIGHGQVTLRPGVSVREYLPNVVTMACFLGPDWWTIETAQPDQRDGADGEREPAAAARPSRHAEIGPAPPPPARRGPSGPRCLKISSILAERRGGRRRRRAATDCAGPCGLGLPDRRAGVAVGGVGSAAAGAAIRLARPCLCPTGSACRPSPARSLSSHPPSCSMRLFIGAPRGKTGVAGPNFRCYARAERHGRTADLTGHACRDQHRRAGRLGQAVAMASATVVLDASGLDARRPRALEREIEELVGGMPGRKRSARGADGRQARRRPAGHRRGRVGQGRRRASRP